MRKTLVLLVMSLLFGGCVSSDEDATTTTTNSVFEHGSNIEAGRSYSFTMSVGCGSPFQANGEWWVVDSLHFVHPDYPAGWPVTILNQGAVDGPDARIEATLTLIDSDHVAIRLADGTPVADYVPGQPLLCG